MTGQCIATALRRDLAHCHARERAAANSGDEHTAFERMCEAEAIKAEIVHEEWPLGLRAEPRLAEMWV